MNRFLGGRIGRPLTLVVALLSLTLALGTPVAANAAVRTPSHVVAKNDAGSMRSYVTGTASRGRTVVGSFTPSKFVERSGKLVAIGKLNVVTRGPGKDLHRVKYGVAMPVKRGSVAQTGTFGSGAKVPSSAALGSCDVLNLVLGPLDLNLLGLEVHLKKVVLDVVAVTGAGNLLGNLLCAVAGLLDGVGVLGQVAALLNQILAVLKA
ncbi:MAG: hypothetical protein ABIQ59_08905 [Nocardioidaceae bacterium]